MNRRQRVRRLAADLDQSVRVLERFFSASARRAAAQGGAALPDGSFPIYNAEDLKNARSLVHHAKDPARAQAHIDARAAALGLGGGKTKRRRPKRRLIERKGGGWAEDLHPRHPAGSESGGEFAPKSGLAGAGSALTTHGATPKGSFAARIFGGDAPDVDTDSLDVAVEALATGKRVRLRSVRQVSTLIDRLGEIANEAARLGKQAPNYDLCKVSVKGTNLFCADTKGFPRAQMPQLKGFPTPGSPADKAPKTALGEVDATPAFIDYLKSNGVKVKDTRERADHLKATQNELVGGKVAALIGRARTEGAKDIRKKAVWVSRDNYILDGHHHWAAVVGIDAADGKLGDAKIAVHRVDLDITDLLPLTNEWTASYGIAAKAAKVTEARRRVRQLRLALAGA